MKLFPEGVVGWAQIRSWLGTVGIEKTREQILSAILESGVHIDADLQSRRPTWSPVDLRSIVRLFTDMDPESWIARYEASNRLVGMDKDRRSRAAQRKRQRIGGSYGRSWSPPEPSPLFIAATPDFKQPFYGCTWKPMRSDSGYLWHSEDARKILEWPQSIWKRGGWITYHGIRRRLIPRDWASTPRVAARRLVSVTIDGERGQSDWLHVPGNYFGLSSSVTTPAVAWMGSEAWLRGGLHAEIQANHPEAEWWISVDRVTILDLADVRGEVERLEAKIMGDPWLPPEDPAKGSPLTEEALPGETPGAS